MKILKIITVFLIYFSFFIVLKDPLSSLKELNDSVSIYPVIKNYFENKEMMILNI